MYLNNLEKELPSISPTLVIYTYYPILPHRVGYFFISALEKAYQKIYTKYILLRVVLITLVS
jgi:hypothetical protein